jgi:predicted nucleic acid-binding protein
MSGRTFLDTNVLVYAVDRRDERKRAIAMDVVARAARGAELVLSTQVLAEFYAVVTRKLPDPLGADDAASAVQSLAALAVVGVDATLVLDAVALATSRKISIWDALILEAARTAGCEKVLSEDLQHGMAVGPLVVENPFLDGAPCGVHERP